MRECVKSSPRNCGFTVKSPAISGSLIQSLAVIQLVLFRQPPTVLPKVMPRPSRGLINTTRPHTPLSTHKGGLMSNRGAHCCFTVPYLLYKPLMIFFSLVEIARRSYRWYRMSSRTGDYLGHILRRDSLRLVVSIYGRSKCFTASQGSHQSCAFQEMVQHFIEAQDVWIKHDSDCLLVISLIFKRGVRFPTSRVSANNIFHPVDSTKVVFGRPESAHAQVCDFQMSISRKLR
jgi:hypothetical protein